MKKKKHKIKSLAMIAMAIIFLSGAFALDSRADELKSTVVQNPYNTLAAQLENKDRQLAQREAALNALEAKLERSYVQVFILVGFLFLLILINFILDYRRRKALINK